MFNNFANSRYVQGPKEFLDGNSLVSKLAFLVFVLIVFVVLLRVGSEILGWLFSPSPSPHLLVIAKRYNICCRATIGAISGSCRTAILC